VLISEINIAQRLSITVPHDKAAVLFFDRPLVVATKSISFTTIVPILPVEWTVAELVRLSQTSIANEMPDNRAQVLSE
jgi:hypothetical protein